VGPSARKAARLSCAALLVLATGSAAGAPSLDVVVSRAVRDNYGALHGCYRKVLAEDRSRGGTLFVRVTLGPADSVKSAVAERDELKHPVAVDCILGWVRGWTLRGAAAAGAGPGAEITIPLTFRPAPGQVVVRGADAPTVSLSCGTGRLLLHEKSVGVRVASLLQMEVSGTCELPVTGGEQLLLGLSGRGRVDAGRSAPSFTFGPWSVALVPAGVGARLHGKLDLLQLFVPAGGEVAYGRSNPSRRRRGKIRIARAGTRPVRLGRVVVERASLEPGARRGAGAGELVYVISGAGVVTRGGESSAVGQGDGAYLTPGAALEARSPMRVIVVRVPAAARSRSPIKKGGTP
jgi:hypothetical protein